MSSYVGVAQVLIELAVYVPQVWRRALQSPFAKLGSLHRVIQAALGWNPDWPHHFVLCGDIYELVHREVLNTKR